MKLKLEIDCDNDAFAPLRIEVARILRNAADRIEHLPLSGKLYDANGNGVGEYHFEEDSP